MSKLKSKSRKTNYSAAVTAVLTAIVLVLGLFGVDVSSGLQTTLTTIGTAVVGLIVTVVQHFTED